MATTAPRPVTDRPAPVGWGRWRLQHPKWSAGLALLVGVPTTAVGAGIAIRHLTKSGLTGTGLLGLALLVAGLALLGFAGVVGWRASHRWQRLWFVPVVVVALLVM